MGTKDPKMVLETHNIVIPYGYTVFGRMFEMPLECVFGYSGDLKTNHVLEITSLTGQDKEGLSYDMMFLVEDEESLLTRHLISCIINNSRGWDVVTEKGTWWNS